MVSQLRPSAPLGATEWFSGGHRVVLGGHRVVLRGPQAEAFTK